MSKLHIFVCFLCFFSFNFYVIAADGLSFKRPVTCEVGHKILIDHTSDKSMTSSNEDYCAQVAVGGSFGVAPASCPLFDQRELRKNLIDQQFMAIEMYGQSVKNVIDRLIRSLERKNRLNFSKIKHRGRDTCVVKISPREIRKFIPARWPDR